MKHIHYVSAFLLSILGLTACDVHEFPVIPEKLPFQLSLECNIEVPIYQEIDYSARSSTKDASHDIRYILGVYKSDDARNFSREADTTIVVVKSVEEERKLNLTLHLEPGLYNFMVWCDYVDKGTDSDKYYNTADFAEIIYADRNNHVGNSDYKEAFVGSTQALIQMDMENNSGIIKQVVRINMERPFAKFKFVSTDYDLFIDKALKAEAAKALENSVEDRVGESEDTRAIDSNDYIVVFRYTGFMPCSYNMFTDKPADAWTGVSFESSMKILEDSEVEMGFDYVFVNHVETSVPVRLEVYHKDGELISSSPSIDVPLKRGNLTVVKGNFLTSLAQEGVGVIPDFDGEYNIEIK